VRNRRANPSADADAGSRRRTTFLVVAALCLAYFLLAKAGLTLASVNPSATPVWPPTGLAIAALLLLGPEAAPAIFLGALLANQTTTGDLPSSIAIGFGNTLEALVAALLTSRWAQGVQAFDKPARVVRFAAICLAVATPISATIGAASLRAAGLAELEHLPPIWVTWWLGDFAGALIVAPAIVLWAGAAQPMRISREEALVFAAAAAIGLIAFSPLFEQTAFRGALAFLVVLPLLWAALRCAPRTTAMAALIVAGFAVWGTNAGGGPFAQDRPDQSFLLLLMFIASLCLTGLVLAANVAAHRLVLAEKDMLLREVHHRVKNNLQVIASMVHLKARQATAPSRPQFEALAERVYALGRIYDQVHNSDNLAEIDMGQSLAEIAAAVRTERIQVEASAPELRLGVDTAIPLALIALELGSNAAKHAFPQRSGTIRMELRQQNGRRAELRISDDGVGFAPDQVHPHSSGLQIVRGLVKQIEGELETRSGSGTEHRILFWIR
jgi:two-component sensor histidine kinase